MTTTWPDDTSILIPAYKAAHLLHKLLPDIMHYAPADRILVIDDASFDNTPQTCSEYHVKSISHDVNKGKGAALATGFSYLIDAGAKWIITMDADGQHSPADLQKFIDAVARMPATGICIGARVMKPGTMPPERILSNRLTSGVLSFLCGVPITDSQCGYRIYNTDFLRRVDIMFNRFEMESEIIMKAAYLDFPVTFTSIQTLYLQGPSHISHFFDTLRWMYAVLRTSFRRRQIINSIHCQ